MLDRTTAIAVAGAGSIGCYAGGCLALSGRAVTLLARPRIIDAAGQIGLAIVDLDGRERKLGPSALPAAADPAQAFAGAGLVLVTVKSGDTAEMAELIARHAPPDATIVSLQNGTGNAARLRQSLPATQRVVAGMVPFNVVQDETPGAPLAFRRTTSGEVHVEADVPGLVDLLNVEGFQVAPAADMTAVLWGKLVLNLGNALNALSGLPLAEQLADRRWRLLFAAQMDEALAVMRAGRHQAGSDRPAAASAAAIRAAPAGLSVPPARPPHDRCRPQGAVLDLAGSRSRAPHRDRRIPGRDRAPCQTGRARRLRCRAWYSSASAQRRPPARARRI